MPEPVNPANNRTWDDILLDYTLNPILTGVHSGTPIAWGATSVVAAPMQRFANWAWQYMPGKGLVEAEWADCTEKEKTSAKRSLAGAAWAGTAATTYLLAPAALAAAPGIVLAGSIATGLTAGLGTAVYSWVKLKNPLIPSLGIGGAAALAAGVGTFAFVPSAVAAGALLAVPAANAVGSTVMMAVNPNHSLIMQVPDRGLLELSTPNTNPSVASSSAGSSVSPLQSLTGKVCEFRSKHPENFFWKDPQLAIIDQLSKTRDGDLVSPLVHAQRALENLTLELMNPSVVTGVASEVSREQQKINVVTQALADIAYPIGLGEINISLIEKMEVIPFDSKEYVAAKEKTDMQLDLLVQKSSIFSTIFFIHINRLGNENTDEVNQAMKKIIKEATAPNADDLWSIYLKHLGKGLCGIKYYTAKFYYWICHDLGITWNTLNEFLKNVISAFRQTVEPKNQENLNGVFKKAFDQLSLFLDLYNGSARKFAHEEGGGNLPPYQKLVIDRLGNDLLYQKVKANLKDDEDFGKKMMEELCTSFTHVLIDECFPTIEIWKEAKSTPVVGFLIVRPIAWLIELIINKVARSETRKRLPYGIQSLVGIGLEQTSSTQYPFKIAIANSLTNLIEGFHKDMKNPITSKPHRLVSSSIIDGAAIRILETLKLKRLGLNPSRPQVLEFLAELANPTEPKIDKILEGLIAQGAKEFMYYYSQKPEKMEGLIGDMFELTNNAFEPGAVVQTEADCEAAFKRLKNATKAMAKDAIKEEIKKEAKGPVTQTVLNEYLQGTKNVNGDTVEPGIYEVQKTRGVHDFERLVTVTEEMKTKLNSSSAVDEDVVSVLKSLDLYAETLKKFAADAEGMNLDIYPKPVQHAFNKTFQPIYGQTGPLIQQVIDLQKPILKYDKDLNIANKLNEILTMIQNGNRNGNDLRKKLEQIEKIGANYGEATVGLTAKTDALRKILIEMETAGEEAEKARLVLKGLIPLEDPAQLAQKLINDPQKWNTRLREAIPKEDRDALFESVRELQAAIKLKVVPDLTPYKEHIQANLEVIFEKYNAKKLDSLASVEVEIGQFTTVAQANLDGFNASLATEKIKLEVRLNTLESDTSKILSGLTSAETPTITIPLSDLPQNAVDDLYGLIGVPMEKKIDPYLDAAFNLITDSDMYQGTARLLMGNVIKAHEPLI